MSGRMLLAFCLYLPFTLALVLVDNARSEDTYQLTDALATTPGISTTTPEMWFYMQELKRYEDPHLTVRRNAESRAFQRRIRLTTLKWLGFSNMRPRAQHTPWCGAFSPAWAGNHAGPYRWSAVGPTTVVIHP